MDEFVAQGQQPKIQQPLKRLQEAAEHVGKAWSGSHRVSYVLRPGITTPWHTLQ